MIKALVECPPTSVAQVRNVARVATRTMGIDGVWQQRPRNLLADVCIWLRVSSLHLIEDHALVTERRTRLFEFDGPAFLVQGVRLKERVEDDVKVDIDKVIEVLEIGAGDRITGLVRECHRVDEGRAGALEELHEQLLHWVLA